MHCGNCGTEQPDEANFCSACGAKTAASARSTGVKPKKKMSGCLLAALIVGASVIVMVPIAGIIAAIAIPNLLNAIDRGKQKRTMADLRTLGSAVKSYSIDHDFYPTANDIEELRHLISPDFVKVVPTLDAWGHPIHVVSTPEGYELVSRGKDGVADGCRGGPKTTFNADICFANGQFHQWPEGTRR